MCSVVSIEWNIEWVRTFLQNVKALKRESQGIKSVILSCLPYSSFLPCEFMQDENCPFHQTANIHTTLLLYLLICTIDFFNIHFSKKADIFSTCHPNKSHKKNSNIPHQPVAIGTIVLLIFVGRNLNFCRDGGKSTTRTASTIKAKVRFVQL